MTGTYPIIIKGENCGELKVSKEGAYTRFVADCVFFGGVIRLSVYGGGEEGYLGVPMPVNGRLHLDKRLSPVSMRAFPQVIERCSLAGEKPEPGPAAEEECVPEPEKEEPCPADRDEEAPEEDGGETTCWYATTDGALVSRDGEREMVALLPEDERVPRDIPGQPRIIDGKEYLVYITKEN